MKTIRYSSMALGLVLAIAMLLAPASICLAQDSPWTTKADMNIARSHHSTCVVNGKIYVIGGSHRTGEGCGAPTSGSVEEYDPSTNKWTIKKEMPRKRESLSISAVNGKIYAIGGSTILCNGQLPWVEVYDPLTDDWDSSKKPMRVGRRGLSTSVVNGKIYAIGGYQPGSDTFLTTVEQYDPLTDTWITKSPMQVARGWFATCTVEGKIYAFGGQVGQIATKTTEEYDPVTDTWIFKADMPARVVGNAASSVNGLIYSLEGTSGIGGTRESHVRVYNPISDIWSSGSPIAIARGVVQASEVNGIIYVIGGLPGTSPVPIWPNAPTATVKAYNPHNDLIALIEKVKVSRNYAKAGIDSVWITTKMRDPAGITLFAEIKAPDQTPDDSLQLFDDGNHGDGSAGDSLFANFWPVLSTEERQYFIDLQVSRVEADTVNQHLNNMASFTTKGPVTIDHAEIDGVVNPGDIVIVRLYFQNNGKTATIADIEGRMTILDSCITNVRPLTRPTLNSLSAGEVKRARGGFQIQIAENCPPGRIPVQVDIYEGGNFYWADTFYVDIVTGVTDNNAVSPDRFVLHQNYPNPFNPETRITYEISKQTKVMLKVMNLLGQEIRILVDEEKPAGSYEVTWDGKDNRGLQVASGVYLYRIEATGFVQVRKMVLLQ